MIASLETHEFELIKQILAQESGILLKDDQKYLIETRLYDLVIEIGAKSFSQFYQKTRTDAALLTRFVDLMTTNETLWFRDKSCWETLEHFIVPNLIQRLENGKAEVTVWSAACSTGQEAYSLVILIQEILEKTGKKQLLDRFRIVGTDLSQRAVDFAKAGRYDPFTMGRGMNEQRLKRFFSMDGDYYLLAPEIRRRAEFRIFNLMKPFVWGRPFDLIFCRNVAIYFSETTRIELFRKLQGALENDGFLIVGATESLLGLKTGFRSKSFQKGVYYQKE